VFGDRAGATTLSLAGPADARQAMQQQTSLPAEPGSPQQAQPERLRYEFEVDIVERIESAGRDARTAISRGTGDPAEVECEPRFEQARKTAPRVLPLELGGDLEV
jgi:hypothetical protein